jgi:hypothetical protein
MECCEYGPRTLSTLSLPISAFPKRAILLQFLHSCQNKFSHLSCSVSFGQKPFGRQTFGRQVQKHNVNQIEEHILDNSSGEQQSQATTDV